MRQPRTTVKLPDGFNGATMLFNVTPVETDGHLVKLSCAEEGKGYLTRWIGRSELQNHINAQDIAEMAPAGFKRLFMLCNCCNRLALESTTNTWIVDNKNCTCIFLPDSE